MQPAPYYWKKNLPISGGSTSSRKTSNNHPSCVKNVASDSQSPTTVSNSLFAKFSALNPLRSRSSAPSRPDISTPFRIVHPCDRTPGYVLPRPREPKTGAECHGALEEMHAVPRDEQQQQHWQCAIEEPRQDWPLELQTQPNNGYRHHRYVGIVQDLGNSED